MAAGLVAPVVLVAGATAGPTWQNLGGLGAALLPIGGVTAANASIVRSNRSILAGVGAGVVVLNGVGYGVGFLVGGAGSRATRIASMLLVGMRDFAVAAALVLAAGLPTIASLPAVAFGVVEMATSAGLAR